MTQLVTTLSDLSLSPDLAPKLAQFQDLLLQWNRRINLTAARSPADTEEHLRDSLHVVPFLQGITRVLDVGSGGGFPVVVVAISPSSNTLYELMGRLEQMQAEVQQLTGKVDEQAYRIDELKKHQTKMYSDFDERLQTIENNTNGTEEATVKALRKPLALVMLRPKKANLQRRRQSLRLRLNRLRQISLRIIRFPSQNPNQCKFQARKNRRSDGNRRNPSKPGRDLWQIHPRIGFCKLVPVR